MSRWRLAASVLFVAVALVVAGRVVVQAFPLTGAQPASAATPAVPSSPETKSGVYRETGPDLRASATSPAASPVPASPADSTPAAASRSAVDVPAPGTSPAVVDRDQAPARRSLAAKVVQRVPPAVMPGGADPGTDAIVAVEATVNTSGFASGPVSLFATGGIRAEASDIADINRIIDARMMPVAAADRMRAVVDALRLWRFEGTTEPTTAYLGFNFAGDQAALAAEPVRVGGTVRQPAKIKDVRPVYPEQAQARGIQGVVILEVLIDGGGVPVQAVALRSIDELTMAAIQAALQWRFTPRQEPMPLLMTVTVNFTLAGPSGVSGGISGGVPGGVVGGIVGGLTTPVPPRVALQVPGDWQAPVRVGGNIQPPTRTKDVRPVYPPIAESARVQGVVIVEVLIGPDGKVFDVKILRSIPLLDQAALDAVRQWEFTPTLLNGNPVPVVMTATVNFTLK